MTDRVLRLEVGFQHLDGKLDDILKRLESIAQTETPAARETMLRIGNLEGTLRELEKRVDIHRGTLDRQEGALTLLRIVGLSSVGMGGLSLVLLALRILGGA